MAEQDPKQKGWDRLGMGMLNVFGGVGDPGDTPEMCVWARVRGSSRCIVLR